MTKQHIMLVDGMALLFRSFYATAVSGYFMVNSKGVPTNAIYGFVKHLFAANKHFNPSHIICCWDMGAHTYRNELFPDYKGNRQEPPVELIPQFDLVKEVTEAFDIPNVGIVGYEADDCIGTLAKKYSESHEVTVLTGDKDLLQIINQNISIALLQKGFGNYLVMNEQAFIDEKEITPSQLVDVKALMGDSSDNYPGVKGIGEKTAIKLIKEYSSIEGILDNLDKLTKGQRTKIEADLEILHLSRKLAEINCEVPVECALEDAKLTIEKPRVLEKFQELEFKNPEKIIS